MYLIAHVFSGVESHFSAMHVSVGYLLAYALAGSITIPGPHAPWWFSTSSVRGLKHVYLVNVLQAVLVDTEIRQHLAEQLVGWAKRRRRRRWWNDACRHRWGVGCGSGC